MDSQSLTLESGLAGALIPPKDNKPLLVMAHGAGASYNHSHMHSIAAALSEYGIGTLRFNFPFMQAGQRRVDKPEVCLATFDEAIAHAQSVTDANLILGGHSFGGRMASHYIANNPESAIGLMCFSFPLHVSKKPAVTRAQHLPDISKPVLFLSGDRDTLAEVDLMTDVVNDMQQAMLHYLETADHSFKILKRTRTSSEDVYAEAARVANDWLESLALH